MVDQIIRPAALPDRPNPVASEKVPVDNGVTVGGATIQAMVLAGRPTATQAEAEAGTQSTKAMTPLTTAQAIVAQGDVRFASFAQGSLADTAVQPGDLAVVATTGAYSDLIGAPPALTDGDKGDIVVSAAGTDWKVARRFDTVSLLLSDTTMAYSGGTQSVSAGQIVEAQGFRYEVASSGASDAHLTTVGGVKLYGLNFDEVTARTRADAESLVIAPAPKAIRVLGYYAPEDAGKPFSYKLVSSEPGHAAKFSLVLATGVTAWYELSELAVNRRMFGARCDWDWATSTGTDDTAAVQAMIVYCNPFPWAGSVAATKAARYKPLAVIEDYIVGASRITQPILLAPFIRWRGLRCGGFFSRGNEIVADFDDKDKFALDSAPYTTDGTRPLGITTTGAQFNANTYSGCPGWELDGVSVVVPSGRNLRGAINRNSAQQSHVRNCNLIGGNIGIQTSSTWGGSLRDNNIDANAVGLLNAYDVTVDDQENNYITIRTDNKPVSETAFAYPTFPVAAGQVKTIGIYNRFSAARLKGNIIEGPEIGIMGTAGYGIRAIDNYMEVVKEYCYMFHTCSIYADIGYTFCANASLIWVDGGSANMNKFDISAHRGGASSGIFHVANMGQGSQFTATEVWGASRFSLPGTTARIAYPDRKWYGSITTDLASVAAGATAVVGDVTMVGLPPGAGCEWVRFLAADGTTYPAPGLILYAFPVSATVARIYARNINASAAVDLPNGQFIACFIDQPSVP